MLSKLSLPFHTCGKIIHHTEFVLLHRRDFLRELFLLLQIASSCIKTSQRSINFFVQLLQIINITIGEFPPKFVVFFLHKIFECFSLICVFRIFFFNVFIINFLQAVNSIRFGRRYFVICSSERLLLKKIKFQETCHIF